MSEFARLEEKLAKLRARERAPDEKRRLRGTGADALLAALVTEIDETILPRQLSFTTPGGTVSLAVANRRLQALLAPAPSSVPADLVGHALPDAEDPKLAELGAALKTALSDAENVTISAVRLKETFASDIGVPAVQLPRVWAVDAPTATDPGEILERFLAGLDTENTAWLRIEGEEVTGQGGPEDHVAKLGETAAVFLDGYFSKFDTAFRAASLACGTLVSSGKDAIFFVEIGSLSAFIVAESGQLLGIANSWQQLVAE